MSDPFAYTIRPANVKPGMLALVEREPTAGKWYVGVELYIDSDIERHGLLAQYVGDGIFTNDSYNSNAAIDMGDYDYLQEQV